MPKLAWILLTARAALNWVMMYIMKVHVHVFEHNVCLFSSVFTHKQ